ncbi:MAG: hypothetical protein ACKOZU_11945 [Planctomycetaceae bacterium]
MLQKNPLRPPLPSRPAGSPAQAGAALRRSRAFTSAEDFDGTGILAGLDPCESRYWWVPDLAASGDAGRPGQATSRPRPAADA